MKALNTSTESFFELNYLWFPCSKVQIILLLHQLRFIIYKLVFYVYVSVHHNILGNNQQMQLYAVNFISLLRSLYMFRGP